MYSVFLVDDEMLIREGIKQMIEWNAYGFSFVGEAADGELAWPLIQKHKPDIVIADIKMPFMDGLALSRLIKKELPETMIVIISGYDEFTYAQQALSIGVNEYLLKPVGKKQLIEVLCQIKKRKDGERARLRDADDQMQDYMDALQNNLLDALLGGRQPVSSLLGRAKRLEMDLTAECYNVVYLMLDVDETQLDGAVRAAEQQSTLFGCFPQTQDVFACPVAGDGAAFLVMGTKDDIEDKTACCIARAEQVCRGHAGIPAWMIGRGEPVERLSLVPQCFRQVRKELFERRVSMVLHAEPQRAGQTGQIDFNPDEMDAGQLDQRVIEKFLSSGREDNVIDFVEGYFDAIGESAMASLMFRQYVTLNIQFSVNAFLERLESHDADKAECRAVELFSSAVQTLDGTKRYVEGLLVRALAVRDRAANSKYSSILSKAVTYMQEHFSDADISLNAVAQTVSVRSTYFSAVFSQQMGKTFVEYLTELRMDKAKTLLRCTDKSSGNIAFEVGYNDPHYFSFLFKKVNGCSPRDYRTGRNGAQ